MVARIFLCHASEDKGQVRDVYRRLADIEAFEPWLDEEDLLPGQDWAYEIPRALEASDFILIFFSSVSVGRRGYVQREMKLALDALQEMPAGAIFTIPVRLDECEVPEPFRRYHYANLFDPRGFDHLVTALRRGIEQRGESVAESLETPPQTPEAGTGSPTIETETQPPPTELRISPDAESSVPKEKSDTDYIARPQTQTDERHLWRSPTIIAAFIAAIAAIIAAMIPEVRMLLTQKYSASLPATAPTGAGLDHAKLPKTIRNSIGMEFVLIPARRFTMGSPNAAPKADNDEKPAHQVTISEPFYMGKYEVTQAQWQAVMGVTIQEQRDKANKSWPLRGVGAKHPMYYVSWDEVQDFINKLNATGDGISCRLPTEAQWEYAARAGSQHAYSFGDDAAKLGGYAWYGDNAGGTTHPVGKKQPNAWGLYDMHGNVWEWVADGKRTYASEAVTNPIGPTDAGADRVIRGGSWNAPAQNARSAYRDWDHPGYRHGNLGFRCLSAVPSK